MPYTLPPLPADIATRFVPPRRIADRSTVCFIDTETTGLDVGNDEIVQVAIVKLDGEVAYSGLIKPTHMREWPEAERVNHISPDMVSESPTLLDEKPRIEEVLASCDIIAGWNVEYDLLMLLAGGINFPKGSEFCDLMPAFCSAWRQGHPDYPIDRNRERLTRVTDWLGIDHDAHDAKGDTEVLVPIWDWVVGRMSDE